MRAIRLILCAVLAAVIIAPSLIAGAQGSSVSVSKPRVMVESCMVDGGGLASDTECKLTILLRNMSTNTEVSSILITGSWSNASPPPVDFKETNQAYVSSIGPAQTREVVLTLKTQSVNISALDSVSLYIDINYSYEDIPENINSVILRIPVSDDLSDEFIPVEIDNLEDNNVPGRLESLFDIFGISDTRLVYAGGSVICALIAVLLIVQRCRRR